MMGGVSYARVAAPRERYHANICRVHRFPARTHTFLRAAVGTPRAASALSFKIADDLFSSEV